MKIELNKDEIKLLIECTNTLANQIFIRSCNNPTFSQEKRKKDKEQVIQLSELNTKLCKEFDKWGKKYADYKGHKNTKK